MTEEQDKVGVPECLHCALKLTLALWEQQHCTEQMGEMRGAKAEVIVTALSKVTSEILGMMPPAHRAAVGSMAIAELSILVAAGLNDISFEEQPEASAQAPQGTVH